MKRSLLLLIPALALFLMACPQKHTTSSDTPAQPDPNGYSNTNNNGNSSGSNSNGSTVTTGNTNSPDTMIIVGSKPDSIRTRLVVSFISTGGGIDIAAQTNLDKWLSKHPEIKYAQNQWGREGEVDYCFISLGTTAEAQNKAVSDVKTLVGSNAKVLMKENKVCTHKHELHVVTMPDVEEAPYLPKTDSASVTRLVVSFLSPGDGIDQVGHANLEKYLSKHPDVKYSKSPEGREGELTYCFKLSDKSKADQTRIVNDIRAAVGTNSKTFVTENKECTHSHAHNEISSQVIAEAPDAPKTDSSNMARVVVSFVSHGEGIDMKAKERLENWLKEQNVEYEDKNWGREGETNICIALKGKTNRQQDIFVRDLRTFIGENELVVVEEWGKCDKRK